MAIKGFIDKHSSVPGASDSHPTKASAPSKDGTFPTGHPMHNKTPAPNDDNAKDYAWGRSEYGANADFTPSSLPPGVSKNVGDGSGLLAQNQDDILDLVQSQGLARDDKPANWQLREIGQHAPPFAHGMSRRTADEGSPGGTIPATTGASVTPAPKTDQYGGVKS